MTLFFGLLALVSLAGGATVVAARVGGRWEQLGRAIGPIALPLAATVATVATVGSLYLSEVEHFVPCRLCWVQRGFMYPLAVILWLAVVQRRPSIWQFAIPWSLAGSAVSAYHAAEQRGWVGGESFCDAAAPCAAIWVRHFGFMTIPVMALSGFWFIAALMAVQASAARTDTFTYPEVS